MGSQIPSVPGQTRYCSPQKKLVFYNSGIYKQIEQNELKNESVQIS